MERNNKKIIDVGNKHRQQKNIILNEIKRTKQTRQTKRVRSNR